MFIKRFSLFTFFLALTLVFSGSSIFANAPLTEPIGVYYPGTQVAVKPGDVLVTNNTSSSGLTGHAGIVLDVNGNVATIDGYGLHPVKKSLSSWFSQNPNTKVMQWNKQLTGLPANVAAQKAADWAANYIVQYKNADYGLVNSLGDFDETYCSKIPWQAFYFGADVAIGGKTPYCNCLYTPYDWLYADGMILRTTIGSW